MGKVVEIGKKGEILYIGMLSSYEKAAVDEIINILKNEIPIIEDDLKEKYGKAIQYKYYLGKVLNEFIVRFNITYSERRKFWDEIKILASNVDSERKRNDGKTSARRTFYEQCSVLAKQPLETVMKLSWRQWQDLLDRDINRADERIFTWIGKSNEKIREDDWREFEKALNLYLKDKDSSVFDDEELYMIYDSIMLMAKKWRELFEQYVKEHPKTTKIKTKGNWSKKYYNRCYKLKKEKQQVMINSEICEIAFNEIM